jgi:two-component system phosphate regulon sensor histidine kinase PhoR
MTGLTPRAFIGHPIPTWLFEGTTFGELGPNIAATIAKQQLWRGEFLMHRLDGATFNADIAVAPMRRGEQSIGYIASIRDVTEMKELERMKDRFVATVSHELRTPVSVIMLHLDNLLEFYTQLSAQQHQHMLGEIQRETDTLHHLIEDLLVLSRVDAGRAQPRYSDWDLRELLDETLQRAEIQAALKHVTLRLSDAPPHLRVRADRDQIAQVLRNLVNNAIKFNLPEGQVTISLEKRDEHIVINVADTGMGIPADDVPKLFQRFYRSRLSVQNEIQGTGLGLAIAAEIVQRHHGDIQVTSELNVGTTFRVTLPLQPPHAPLLNSGRWYV